MPRDLPCSDVDHRSLLHLVCCHLVGGGGRCSWFSGISGRSVGRGRYGDLGDSACAVARGSAVSPSKPALPVCLGIVCAGKWVGCALLDGGAGARRTPAPKMKVGNSTSLVNGVGWVSTKARSNCPRRSVSCSGSRSSLDIPTPVVAKPARGMCILVQESSSEKLFRSKTLSNPPNQERHHVPITCSYGSRSAKDHRGGLTSFFAEFAQWIGYSNAGVLRAAGKLLTLGRNPDSLGEPRTFRPHSGSCLVEVVEQMRAGWMR